MTGVYDGLLAYYKGTNAVLNTKHLYAGNKPEMSATPSHQPELLKKPNIVKPQQTYQMNTKQVQQPLLTHS